MSRADRCDGVWLDDYSLKQSVDVSKNSATIFSTNCRKSDIERKIWCLTPNLSSLVDLVHEVNQNSVMRTVTTCISVALLLFVNLYGPLLHEHPAGDADGNAIIHAHFPELETTPVSKDPSIGFHHSHARAIWLDGFTTTASHGLELHAIVTTTLVHFSQPLPATRFVSVEAPRSHSPPALCSRVPRSPPA